MKNYVQALMLLTLGGCASIAMPTGGPRDETPPELVSSVPKNNQLNFTEKTIELTFDEDIKLKDPKEEILIVPTAGKNTLFSVKKRKLIIEPELPWIPNTTYSINFREGVADITEGNPAENLRLAFSTGSTIDSLYISGSVRDMFSEKIPTKITIALYQQDTFDIFKHSPIYFTKADKDGLFIIPNLKSDEYFIYAFDDKNKNLKVDSKTEKFGYLINSIELVSQKDSVEVPLIVVDSRPLRLTSIRHTDKTSRLRFNKQVDSLTVIGITPEQSLYAFGSDKSELIFYNAFTKGDSIKTHLIAHDSLGQKIDTMFFIKYGEVKTVAETFATKELDLNYDVPTKMLTYKLSYNKPLWAINNDSIVIRYDSITSKRIDNANITVDSLHNSITLKSLIETPPIPADPKVKPKTPELILGRGALITIDQDSSKRIIRPIKIAKEEDLGMVAIKVETLEKNYIIEIVTSDNKVVQSVSNIKEHTFKYLEPKQYKLRVIIDSNKNKKWDNGNFYDKTEPEKVILIEEDGEYSFPLRANWEYGPVLIKF